jgi:hypothetical protein
MTQHEITESRPLLDASGTLAEPGYAKRLLPVYRRADIRAGRSRIKEWDYYLVTNGRFAVALTVADNGYMGMDSISFLNFDEGWEKTVSPICAFPMGRRKLPETSAAGDISVRGKKHALSFVHEDGQRILSFMMDDFCGGRPVHGRIALSDEPAESMVIATPFDKPGHFYYNQKINVLRAEGYVTVCGKTYEFRPDTAFAVLDWGRGVWTYHNTWYWGSASGALNGVPFGWNIGYGFGDTSAATENMLFYGGRAHKLGRVTFNIPQKDGAFAYMSPWTFTSDDGRFEMAFTPVLDRASRTDLFIIMSDQHQVFGRFTGTAVLDDGTTLAVTDFFGFAEHVENKW